MSAEREEYIEDISVEDEAMMATEDDTDTNDDDDFAASLDKARQNGRYYSNSVRQLDATQLYLNEIGFSPLLTPEEEVYYARLAQKGEESGRKRMIESNLRSGGQNRPPLCEPWPDPARPDRRRQPGPDPRG